MKACILVVTSFSLALSPSLVVRFSTVVDNLLYQIKYYINCTNGTVDRVSIALYGGFTLIGSSLI